MLIYYSFSVFSEYVDSIHKMWKLHISPTATSGLMTTSRLLILIIQPFRKQCKENSYPPIYLTLI